VLSAGAPPDPALEAVFCVFHFTTEQVVLVAWRKYRRTGEVALIYVNSCRRRAGDGLSVTCEDCGTDYGWSAVSNRESWMCGNRFWSFDPPFIAISERA
jgi:hypothetical protein